MRIFHISISSITNASRIFKEASAARKKDFSVTLLGLGAAGLPETEILTCGTELRRLALWTRGLPKSLPFQMIKLLEWMARLTIVIARKRPDIIHCHSLATLPFGVVGKRLGGARLLYDAHELETERNGLVGLRQRMARRLERWLIGYADHTIVVGPRIKDWYENKYPGLKISCVRNIPETEDPYTASAGRPGEKPLNIRNAIRASKDDIIILYLGGLTSGRGIEFLCITFAALPSDTRRYQLVFIGYGPLEAFVQGCAKRSENIHFLPSVAPEEVVSTAKSADIGVCLLSSTALSYRFALPNKLFEYVSAGLPVIVNDDYPEMSDFVSRYVCGWRIPPSGEVLTRLLQELTPEDMAQKQSGASKAAAESSWETEASKLLEIYDNLLKN